MSNTAELLTRLDDCANRLRVTTIEITAAAKSGHPSSCLSAAEIMASLFFYEMKYDPKDPRNVNADRFVLSKAHACPILYAAWHEAGLLTLEECAQLRNIDSNLEGHPTPRLNFIDAAMGSLGQGLSVACGMAFMGKKYDRASYRIYCLLGDAETSDGCVWEAAAFAALYKLDNLLAIVDVNRYGQTRQTVFGHDLESYARRFKAFGWHVMHADGHNTLELLLAYKEARKRPEQPSLILAKTFKGRGIPDFEDCNNCHGKIIEREKADLIRNKLINNNPIEWVIPKPKNQVINIDWSLGTKLSSPPEYEVDSEKATRKALGVALVKLATSDTRVVVLDNDVSNSTYSQMVKNRYPMQGIECFMAIQSMVGIAVGLSCRARCIPFVSTFAAFLSRGADQIRMAALSFANVKFCGSHAGISVGEDGPSHMGLEDLALFRSIPNSIILYPSDAVSAEYAAELAVNTPGIVYIRTTRPVTKIIYSNQEKFVVGKSKVLRKSARDQVLVIGAGITLHEALTAYEHLKREAIFISVMDLFCVKPLDLKTLVEEVGNVKGRVVVVEDHYEAGGIGEAIATKLIDIPNIQIRRLFIQEVPRSGAYDELMQCYGISASHIVKTVKQLI